MIRLTAVLTKKIPHPAFEFGSIGASFSLEVECASGQDPVLESQRLFRQLDQALEIELQRQTTPASAVPVPQAPAGPARPSSNPPPATAPAPPRQGRSRGPAPITASQIRLLERLLSDQPGQRDAILAHCQAQVLEHLTCKQGSEAIDALKGAAR